MTSRRKILQLTHWQQKSKSVSTAVAVELPSGSRKTGVRVTWFTQFHRDRLQSFIFPTKLSIPGSLGPRDSKTILDARVQTRPRNSDSYKFGFRGQNRFSPFLYRFKSSICLLDSTSLVLLFILKTSSLSDLFFKFKSS